MASRKYMSIKKDDDFLARLDRMVDNFCSIDFLCSFIVMLFCLIFIINNPEGDVFFVLIYFLVFCIALVNMIFVMIER